MQMIAKYTEVLYNLLQDERTKEMIDNAMSEYPMYTPENPVTFSLIPTREELNKMILDHFKYREIGFETVGRFIEELRITMNEIMPFYYQLYKTEDIMNGLDDIFGNVDMVESYIETNSATGNTSANGSATSSNTSSTSSQSNDKTVSSDTPQGELSITNMNIDDVTYGNNANWSKNNTSTSGTDSGTSQTTNTGTSSSTGQIEHTLTRKGNQGVNTYGHDMGELRNIFMNITQDIIDNPRLQELFMMIY